MAIEDGKPGIIRVMGDGEVFIRESDVIESICAAVLSVDFSLSGEQTAIEMQKLIEENLGVDKNKLNEFIREWEESHIDKQKVKEELGL